MLLCCVLILLEDFPTEASQRIVARCSGDSVLMLQEVLDCWKLDELDDLSQTSSGGLRGNRRPPLQLECWTRCDEVVWRLQFSFLLA